MRKELEERLIRLCGGVYQMLNDLTPSFTSEHLGNQIIRSVTSAALNYGEAQGSVSKKDFIHKSSLVLKELRETHINLKIIESFNIHSYSTNITILIDECNQLVSIFHKTVLTAKSNIKA